MSGRDEAEERESGKETKPEENDITAGDCGAPREMEYANEEEWPPNSRQVLYYFFAPEFLCCFECFPKRKRTENRFRPNFFRLSAVPRRRRRSPESREILSKSVSHRYTPSRRMNELSTGLSTMLKPVLDEETDTFQFRRCCVISLSLSLVLSCTLPFRYASSCRLLY